MILAVIHAYIYIYYSKTTTPTLHIKNHSSLNTSCFKSSKSYLVSPMFLLNFRSFLLNEFCTLVKNPASCTQRRLENVQPGDWSTNLQERIHRVVNRHLEPAASRRGRRWRWKFLQRNASMGGTVYLPTWIYHTNQRKFMSVKIHNIWKGKMF